MNLDYLCRVNFGSPTRFLYILDVESDEDSEPMYSNVTFKAINESILGLEFKYAKLRKRI